MALLAHICTCLRIEEVDCWEKGGVEHGPHDPEPLSNIPRLWIAIGVISTMTTVERMLQILSIMSCDVRLEWADKSKGIPFCACFVFEYCSFISMHNYSIFYSISS